MASSTAATTISGLIPFSRLNASITLYSSLAISRATLNFAGPRPSDEITVHSQNYFSASQPGLNLWGLNFWGVNFWFLNFWNQVRLLNIGERHNHGPCPLCLGPFAAAGLVQIDRQQPV